MAAFDGGGRGPEPRNAVLCLVLSHVQLFLIPRTVVRQAPLSMRFSGQEYWSGLPCPSPGDLPKPGMEPRSPAVWVDSLPSESPAKPQEMLAASKEGEGKKKDSLLEPPGRNPVLFTPQFSPSKIRFRLLASKTVQ